MSDLYIADKYARALFEVVDADEKVSVGAVLGSLWNLLSSDEIYVKLLLSRASPKAMSGMILNTMLDGMVSPLLSSFFRLLLENNRLYLLGKIQHKYQEIIERENGVVVVTFTTAKKASNRELELLSDILRELDHKVVNLEDHTILSGFLLKIDNNLLDCSLDRMLHDIHKVIKNYDIGAK